MGSPISSFFKTLLAIPGPPDFHMNFRTSMTISAKKPAGILTKTESVDQFQEKSTLTIQSFPTHEHGMSFRSVL